MAESARNRLFLSAPHANEDDVASVEVALRSGWIAPAGPSLTEFEDACATYVGRAHAVGLSSGTAALHLGMKSIGVGEYSYVLVPSVTFAATAFAVTYLGAKPFILDVEPEYGTLDAGLLEQAVTQVQKEGRRVAAVVPVDLYGCSVDYGPVMDICGSLGIPVLEDAAEGLGGSYGEAKLGSRGEASVLSFNGNKILTTSGGGMLLTDDQDFAQKVRKWATQSREPVVWYEHEEIGYNYRLSNILAALGLSQLRRIDETVDHRRQVREWYREGLSGLAGVSVMEDPPWGRSNAWLTVARFDEDVLPGAPERVRLELEEHNIESRPVWKPMHQQPVFASAPSLLTGTSDLLFREGLCLPSGPVMTQELVAKVCELIRETLAT